MIAQDVVLLSAAKILIKSSTTREFGQQLIIALHEVLEGRYSVVAVEPDKDCYIIGTNCSDIATR